MLLVAIFADFLAPHSPIEQFRDAFLQPPAWVEGGSWSFLLGTDAVGRDMLSRIIYGARLSLFIGSSSSPCLWRWASRSASSPASSGGLTDTAIMRLMDIILSFPSLLLALVMVAILGPGLFNAMIAVAIVYVPHYVRLTRAAVHDRAEQGLCDGLAGRRRRHLRLMFMTVLPNCMAPLIVQATLGFSTAILDAAALGFLGMGAQPPTPGMGHDAGRFAASSSCAPGGW